jgi:hypothetical protein
VLRGRCTSPTNTVPKEHTISAPKLFFATLVATVVLGTPLAQAATAAYPPGPTAHADSAFPPGPTARAIIAI